MSNQVTKRAYQAPTLERMPIGVTANDSALNSDVKPFSTNTAIPPSGS